MQRFFCRSLWMMAVRILSHGTSMIKAINQTCLQTRRADWKTPVWTVLGPVQMHQDVECTQQQFRK
jgi:hypothetical protein